MDANASAKVAMCDEVWQRPKWLRFAWVRNHNWIAVAVVGDAAIPTIATSASRTRQSASAAKKQHEDGADSVLGVPEFTARKAVLNHICSLLSVQPAPA